MEEFNVDWKAECGKLNLAHLTKNKNMKKKLKQTNTSAHLVRSKSKIDRVSSLKKPERLRRKNLWNILVLSLEFNAKGVRDCESEVMTVMRWCAQDEVNQDEWTRWGGRNEEGSWFHMWGDANLKERLVICNEEDTCTDGRVRVTTDEVPVLPEDWTEIRLYIKSGWLVVRTL